MKKALVVFAHPNLKSYCGAFRDLSFNKLNSMGFQTVQSDLYQMNFNPILSLEDIASNHKKPFLYAQENKALNLKHLKPDIQLELEKVLSSDYLIFIAPTWFGTFPAMLKGWFERVFVHGFVCYLPTDIFARGYLKGKKCLIVTTTGFGPEYYAKEGKEAGGQTIEENYWHVIEQIFAYCGMETLPMFTC